MSRILTLFLLSIFVSSAQSDDLPSFPVSYISADSLYLRGGTAAGLAVGFRLNVRRLAPGEATMSAKEIAEIVVDSVATNSAVCRIVSRRDDVKLGDIAVLSTTDAQVVQMMKASNSSRRYAQVISFTEGDPIEEETRKYVPRPKLAEVNRVRGRVSVEQNAITDRITSNAGSSSTGVALRADMTRIGGTYWNFTGYWRARMNQRQSSIQQQTLTDLINRTYHIGMFYSNPESKHTIGAGRLLLPWASSLDTLDGAYYGYRIRPTLTVGAFGGTTPDPTSWNFAPNRQMTGVFAAIEKGSYETVRYNGTFGIAHTRRNLLAEREFAFTENTLLFGQKFTIYHNLQADRLSRGRLGNTDSGVAVGRSFLTIRAQPVRWLSLDVNHNYFRGIPTFDSRLIGTGLLDKYLFAGLSWGGRVDLPQRVSLYGSLGRSKRDGESGASWNHMQGITIANFFDSGLRIDFRRSVFNSSYGGGQYFAASFSREITNRLRFEAQAGKQNFQSPLTESRRSLFLSTNLEWFLSEHYTLGAGYVVYRGKSQNYDQYFTNFGYRF